MEIKPTFFESGRYFFFLNLINDCVAVKKEGMNDLI